jgi:hypothetical protein
MTRMANESRSGWTVDTLHEHFTKSLAEQDRRHEARTDAAKEAVGVAMAAADRAVLKAEGAAERRFESVNEFRNTLADQQRSLMPRTEAEIRLAALDARLVALEQARSAKGGAKEGWGFAVGVVGLIAVVLTIMRALLTP